jgi:hypothetical protein
MGSQVLFVTEEFTKTLSDEVAPTSIGKIEKRLVKGFTNQEEHEKWGLVRKFCVKSYENQRRSIIAIFLAVFVFAMVTSCFSDLLPIGFHGVPWFLSISKFLLSFLLA